MCCHCAQKLERALYIYPRGMLWQSGDCHFSLFLFQVRGSIPLLWEQIVDLTYKPRLKIIHNEETVCTILHKC